MFRAKTPFRKIVIVLTLRKKNFVEMRPRAGILLHICLQESAISGVLAAARFVQPSQAGPSARSSRHLSLRRRQVPHLLLDTPHVFRYSTNMLAAEFQKLVDVLTAGGPYAILVGLAFAYWRKDQYISQLHKQILDLSVQNVQAITSMKGAIDGLKDTLNSLSAKL